MFTLHFLLPLIIVCVVVLHVLELHKRGSSSKLGGVFYDRVRGFYIFGVKDVINLVALFLFCLYSLLMPYSLSDADSFEEFNLISSPVHITPEWYFLFAYAILRSIPNKLGGVYCLVMSVFSFLFLVYSRGRAIRGESFVFVVAFVVVVVMLT